MKFKIILFLLLFILLVPLHATAETIIYDNITADNAFYIRIDDISNMKYINDYNYEVHLNNYYLGDYAKGEKISVPDNTSVLIVVGSGIKQEVSAGRVSSLLGTFVFGLMQYGIYIIIILIAVYFLFRRRRR